MLENGMIVGAERYDPQCQDVKMQRCGRYIVNIKPDPAKNYRFQAVRSV